MSALIVNLFGGPGTGKSTTMAGTFSKMKLAKINCEMIPEYAKDMVWQESFKVLENQIYVFGKQYHRIFRTMDKVDCVITDSPILLSIYYSHGQSKNLESLVLECHNNMNTLNIMLRRIKDYNPIGRMQTEEEAKDIDWELELMLAKYQIPYLSVVADAKAPDTILRLIERRLNEENRSS